MIWSQRRGRNKWTAFIFIRRFSRKHIQDGVRRRRSHELLSCEEGGGVSDTGGRYKPEKFPFLKETIKIGDWTSARKEMNSSDFIIAC